MADNTSGNDQVSPVIVIHGGAGTINQALTSDETADAFHVALHSALMAGTAVLNSDSGTAREAVIAAVQVMENCPLFNAGLGAVFDASGGHQLDASIMDGATLQCGGVIGVRDVKNPILLANAILQGDAGMEHVLLAGEGASEYADVLGPEQIERVPQDYFDTEGRLRALRSVQAQEAAVDQITPVVLDHEFPVDAASLQGGTGGESSSGVALPPDAVDPDEDVKRKMGTVGAVAVDRHGNVAAATSTGGMTNKRFGRVGDSPLIGAGTIANNATAAVSCTGHGEAFIRAQVATDVHARIKYGGMALADAAEAAIHEGLAPVDGSGGLIAVNAKGEFATPMNTSGMYRGVAGGGGAARTAIWSEWREHDAA